MKSVLCAVLPLLVAAGCQSRSTLDEAQDQCMKKGGMLMIIYTQELSLAGAGPQVASPGDCILPSKFDTPAPSNPTAKSSNGNAAAAP